MIGTWREWLVAAGVLVGAIAIAVALLFTAKGQESVPPLQASEWDALLDELDREAIAEAYRRYMTEQFLGWMRDARGQPDRALIGSRKARAAFIASMTAVSNRK